MDELPLVLVINLKTDVARWQKISSALQEFGLPIIRVRAIDARRKWSLIRSRIKRSFFSVSTRRQMSPGECGCALSHIAALKRVVRSKAASAIVLEDDAIFSDDFARFVASDLRRFLRKCDVVKLEGIEYSYTSKFGPTLSTGCYANLIVPFRPTLGSAAYAVTQAGARDLLRTFAKLFDPLDHMLVYYEQYRVTYGETRPFFVRQDAVASNIDAERRASARRSTADEFMRVVRKSYRGGMRIMTFARTVARARLREVFGD